MTIADLLQLRRDVARVLPPLPYCRTNRPNGELRRAGRAALWVCVLEDDGTVGVLLGELDRRGARPTVHTERLIFVVYDGPDGRRHNNVHGKHEHIGHALAAALVAVAGGSP